MNNIILDTDPGIDDAVAIAVLMKEKKEQVKLILSSYGNISADAAARNTLTMLSLLDIDDIPVLRSSLCPLSGKWEEAKHIHGEDGLGGLSLASEIPTDKIITDDFIKITYEKIIECGKVDYITLGPLTNLARLITEYPDVTEHIETVVSMGGGIKKGNVRPYAEFNIFCDPQAAKIVFLNVKKLALVPLNTTLTVSLNTEQINAISEETKLSSAMKKILAENYKNCVKYGEPGSTMHDSTAVLYYLCPELFETKVCGIDVNVKDRPGETEITESRSNILITTKCESGVLIDKILKSI